MKILNILILGGSGQLGQAVNRELKDDFKVVCLSKSQLSITNKSAVEAAINKFKPQFIINCSAYTKVELAEIESEKAYAINYEGVKNLTKVAKLNKAALIHFSTDYVYDGKKKSAYIETDKASPINQYGFSKLKGENYITKNSNYFFIFRISGVFSHNGENFVKSMMRLKDRDELAIVSDQIMKPSSAKFIANFLRINLLKNNFTEENSGLYNLPSQGSEISWHDFAKLIFQEMLAQKLIIKTPKVTPILTKDYKSSVSRPKFSVLSGDKVQEKFILRNADYKKNLKSEINMIYQSL